MASLHPSTARQLLAVAVEEVRKQELAALAAGETAEQQTLLPHLEQPTRVAVAAVQTGAAVFLALAALASSSSVTHSVWHKDFK
jgi:hypothetical protein